MMGYATVLAAIVPVFLLMGLGAALRATRRLEAEADSSLMRMVVQVFYPALILRFILGNEALAEPSNLILAPAVGFGTICVGFVFAWVLGRILGLKRGAGHRTFAFTGGINNYGYMAIPVVAAIFPENQESILGVLLLFNVGIEVAIWTVGIVLITGQFKRDAWRHLFNPPVIALAVAVTLSLTGAAPHLPGWFYAFIDFLARCAIPLGLILAGASLADLAAQKSDFIRPLKVPIGACFQRLALMPVFLLLVAVWVPGLSLELRTVLMVQAAMPAGIFPIVMARHYGGHELTAIQVVLATSIFSLLTTPLWIDFGVQLLH